jgi:hypothetical protein
MPPKTICAISRPQFLAKAEPLKIDVGGFPMIAEPREFSTGSFGWYLNGKASLQVDGKNVSVQVGMNLIVVGSKETAKSEAAASEGEAKPE